MKNWALKQQLFKLFKQGQRKTERGGKEDKGERASEVNSFHSFLLSGPTADILHSLLPTLPNKSHSSYLS